MINNDSRVENETENTHRVRLQPMQERQEQVDSETVSQDDATVLQETTKG